MANIFNDSAEPIREAGGTTSGNFTNLTVQNLIAENAAIDNLNVDNSLITTGIQITGLSTHSILTTNNDTTVNSLIHGNNNDVLTCNGLDPVWTNSLILQNLQTNTLKIPTTLNGDILVFNGSSEAQRLGVGTSGQFLISDGTNPTWNDLPNPLILGGLQLNGNAQLTSFPNRTLITDNTGFIVSEQPQYTSGSGSLTTTPTQIYGVVSWQFTQNAWYSLKFQINTSTNTAFHGNVFVNSILIGYVNNIGGFPNTWYCEFTYNHTASTGTYPISLDNFVTSSGTANYTFSIKVERTPTPDIHA